MRVLIAEDDITSRTMLATTLQKFGCEPVETADGLAAWQELQKPDAPKLAILDWLMPGLNGIEVLRRVRALPTSQPPYILMLTTRSSKEEIVAGLEAGANDYLIKPYNLNELRARLAVGRRMTEIQHELAVKIQDVQEERSRLQAIIQSNRDGLIMIGSSEQIMAINQASLRLLNLSDQPSDWQGCDLQQLVDALQQSLPEADMAVKTLRQTATSQQADGPIVQLELGPYTVRWETLPVMIGQKWLGQLLVLQDITEEQAVARLRTDLIRTMVHDLRNPLAVIIGTLELIMEETKDSSDEYSLTLLQHADKSSRRMLNLITSILDISRMESNRMPLAMQLFSLNQLVVALCKSQRQLARPKGITLINNLPTTLPLAWGDQEVIGRVLQNLIGNALKFTPENGRIQIDAVPIEQDGHSVLQVTIQDTGPGIPPELEDRLFEQFTTGSHPAAGSGLGLAYCRMALEAHGQQIQVENGPEGGAIFTFTLAVGP